MSTIIERVIEHFGSRAKLARVLGVDRSALTQWVRDGAFPPKRAIQIEELSDGKFKAKDIIAEWWAVGDRDDTNV